MPFEDPVADPGFFPFAVVVMADLESITSIITPLVQGLGLVVVRVSLFHRDRFRRLRVDVDRRREGPVPVPYRGSTVTAGELDRATREISAVLDNYDPVGGSYVLEVSTPGLDRHIGSVDEFRDFRGHEVSVHFTRLVDGRRHVRGILSGVEGEGHEARMTVQDSAGSVTFGLDAVDRANLVPAIQGFPSSPIPRKSKEHGKGRRKV